MKRGCGLLILKSKVKRSQPAAAPTGTVFQSGKEQILLSDVIDAIASASLVAQFSVIASEGLRISCHRLRSASLCVAFGRWINSATACGYSLP
ncbi:hypothetical protein EMIT0P4_10527 [Pseudomonas sp. IT-P4]